jgi:hypothetical protein
MDARQFSSKRKSDFNVTSKQISLAEQLEMAFIEVKSEMPHLKPIASSLKSPQASNVHLAPIYIDKSLHKLRLNSKSTIQ